MLGLDKFSYHFCWSVGGVIFNLFCRFSVQGRENLSGLKGPLIVVFNHSSWLDTFLINVAIPPGQITPIHYGVWIGHYRKFLPLMLFSGMFPVERGVGLEQTLAPALKILQKGGIVGLAPEGRRRHLGRPRRPRRGTAFLALKTNCQILPLKIEGVLGLSLKEFLFKKPRLVVKLGRPFRLASQEIKTLDDLNAPAGFIMEAINKI